ncbi:MAG: phosphoribosylformylglycinamidine synthase subunit PurQ [Acidimicrobiales bacterium]
MSLDIDGKPSVLIPIAPGTNRNEELALAFHAAGAVTAQVPLQQLRNGDVKLVDHQLLALPGGFSYGDALGAGRLLGLDLSGWFAEQLLEAREREMPIIGICNGFQALVKAGLLPGGVEASPQAGIGRSSTGAADTVVATLTDNAKGRFECRWVNLLPAAAHSPWMAELTQNSEAGSQPQMIRCPVAHGEGRFVSSDLAAIEAADLVALRYCKADGTLAAGSYPDNPNGSGGDVAGIVDPTGLVLGLMPHPEDHVFERQDPQRRRRSAAGQDAEGNPSGNCLGLFRSGVQAITSS